MKKQNETQVQTFENLQFGTLRTIEIDGEPWFVGKEVALMLGYERGSKAVTDHVDEDDRLMVDGKTQSYSGIELGQRGGWLINESGLYSLIFSSKLPDAKKFKHWVTSKVLPSIRKTGGYVVEGREQEFVNSNAIIHKELQELKLTITALQNQLNVTPVPDSYTQNIWKKYQSTPSIDKLAETLSMNEADAFDLVYEYMKNHFGFEPAVAIREYCDKYQIESTSTITAISDNVVYRTLFTLSVNSILSNCGGEYSCVDEVDSSNVDSDDTIEHCTQIRFTKNDSYDYVIATLSQILNETSTNYNAILRKIYSKMATKQAWKNSMTRWKCTTKKALIEKNEKYRSRFVKVCNEFLEEEVCELFG